MYASQLGQLSSVELCRYKHPLRGVLTGAPPIVKRFLGENFLSPVKIGPQNGANSGKWGLDMRFYVRDSKKAHQI